MISSSTPSSSHVGPAVGGLSSALKGDLAGAATHAPSKTSVSSSAQIGTPSMRSQFVLPPAASYFNASYGNVPTQVRTTKP